MTAEVRMFCVGDRLRLDDFNIRVVDPKYLKETKKRSVWLHDKLRNSMNRECSDLYR